MKFTYGWLKEHLETDATLDEVADTLTMIGLEVEGVEDRAKGLESFLTAHVTAAEKHPDADKLQVCTVDNGSETFQVVCGAPNAKAGMTGVFAGSGAYVPGTDMTLKKAEIRGVESNGMLLSEREMGLSDAHDGIVELAEGTDAGLRAVDVMGLADPIIEIAITPNRGDCLGVRGIARDLAAAGLGRLKPLSAEPVPGTFESPIKVEIDEDAKSLEACPQFVGRYIRGVSNGESPQWLKDRLLAIGLRPISALVDITNLMTMDLNRPLHVFDADLVKGGIHVRMGREGEIMTGLDDKEYTLDPEITVIADEQDAEALGGIMGGLRTGCTDKTVNVFIEAAQFDPVRTATTGRKLNLITDARFRFERGIDLSFAADGMEIATRLVLDICGGEPSELAMAGAEPLWRRAVPFRIARIKELTGVEIETGEVDRILTVLGFTVEGDGDALSVIVPPWRSDIVGEACLVEEVIRINGYDKIPTVPLGRDSFLPQPALSAEQSRRALARRVLAERGMVEAVTLSFMPSDMADLFGGTPDELRLVNPISSDLDVMRPSVLPNLIAAAGRNIDRGIGDGALFEVGPQYSSDDAKGQAMMATGIRFGRTGHRNWAEPPRAIDVFDAKADALGVLGRLGLPVDKLQAAAEAPDWYHPGRSGLLKLGPKNVLAAFGEIHPGVLRKMGIKGTMSGFELFLDALPALKKKSSATRPHLTLSMLQPVQRDFAFIVDQDVAAGAVLRAARSADPLVVDVRVFDVFSGGSLDEGKKSLAINVILQPTEKTLDDAALEAVSANIVEKVSKATGGALRS